MEQEVLLLFSGGEPFMPMAELESANGKLEITLNVHMLDKVIEWLTLHRRAWNGEIPGKVWRIRRGDNVTVTIVRANLDQAAS